MRTWGWVLLAGCGPAVLNVEGSDDTDVVVDTDPDTDTDTETDTEPPGPLTWSGTREFAFESGCDDSVDEDGVQILAETADDTELQALDLCGNCDWVFRIQVSPDRICDGYVPIATEVFRGVQDMGDRVRIYNLVDEGGGRWSRYDLAIGKWENSDQTELGYEYDGTYYNYPYTVFGLTVIE